MCLLLTVDPRIIVNCCQHSRGGGFALTSFFLPRSAVYVVALSSEGNEVK